ncbi:MAG: transglutaminase-like domain-containing protein [Planctomycetota bacterium]|nr:transglutaminase-like domain-containing protein [Planctomycetota bacterium]
MRRVLPLTALFLLCTASAVRADDEAPRRLAIPADMIASGRTTWYGIYFGQTKVGWALKQVGPLEKRGDRFLRSRYVLHMRTKSRGQTKTTRIERRKIYEPTPPYALRGASSVVRRGEFTKRVVVRRDGGRLTAEITEGDERRRLPVKGALPTFADETTPGSWFRATPAVGAELRYHTFDLSSLRIGASTLRVTGRSGSGFRADLVSAAGDRDRVVYDASGALVSTKMMGLMEARRETREQAQRLDAAVDPAERGEVKIDRPIGQAEYVRNLVVRVRGPGAEQIRSAPGQAASYDTRTQTLTLWIGPKVAPPVRATPAEIQRALAEDATYPIRHRVVAALAKETAAKGETTREQVEALVLFVQEFVIDSNTVDPLTVLDVLADQRGDCNEHALLFTTLARAAGIPAREVYGLIYKDDNKRVFGRHAWAEVVIDGVWVPVDPMWGETTLSAAHVRLGAKGEGPDLRLALGGGRMEVVKLDREPPPGDADDGN